MRLLGEREISSILLEGGGKLNGSMLAAGLVDRVKLFFGPKIVGGSAAPSSFEFEGIDRMADAITLIDTQAERFGEDWCITGTPVRNEEG